VCKFNTSNYQIRNKWLKLLSVFAHKNFTPKPFIKFGTWTHTGIRLRTRRESYFCPTSMKLYHWHSDRYWHMLPTRSSATHFQLHEATEDWLPTDISYPIQVYRVPNKDGTNCYFAEIPSRFLDETQLQPPPSPTPPDSFLSYLRQLPKLEYYILKNTRFPDCPRTTMRAIQQATDQGLTLYEVSDGSISNKSLSFGWVLGTNTGQRLAWNNGPGYGTNTSHRSEGWAK
jgi:hypothetical protein